MNQFLHLGHGWEISPAGGATGEAYLAEHKNEKLFLKRNSSPFLAVLSAEGIVPKLIWTKRMENGDVFTAQRWLEGRTLDPHEMAHHSVAVLMSKIHHSKELLQMSQRMGTPLLYPQTMFTNIKSMLDRGLANNQVVSDAMSLLSEQVQTIDIADKVVCHGDINHNNWLVNEDEKLFLIDWDGAKIADPALDLGLLLYGYVDQDSWEDWLAVYGVTLTPDLLNRMTWYVVSQTILAISWYHVKNDLKQKEQWLTFLEQLLATNP